MDDKTVKDSYGAFYTDDRLMRIEKLEKRLSEEMKDLGEILISFDERLRAIENKGK